MRIIRNILSTLILTTMLACGLACDLFNQLTPTPTPTHTTSTELQIHFIDVGQGDAILIDLGATEVLIDGGDRSPGVVDYLDDFVDGDLEVMVATHPHADHIGGLIEVFDEFAVDEVWISGGTSTSKTYDDFMDGAASEGAQVITAQRGDSITAGALTFEVLHPITPLFNDPNNDSIVLLLSYDGFVFLFTGDAEVEAEESMIDDSVLTDIDVLKVGHHGSHTASSAGLLDIAQPEIAVYMTGVENKYGHPHQETIDALEDIGAEIYGTDVYGTIIITCNGGLTVSTEKTP